MRSKNYSLLLLGFFLLFSVFAYSLEASPIVINEASNFQLDSGQQTNAAIMIDVNASPTAVDGRVLGTNLPAWLGPSRTENSTFIARTNAAQPSIIRIPGGSWSNDRYDWSSCENWGGECTWALRPTDFINFLQATGAEGMYTINMNESVYKAAAAVAFFNGATTDNRDIGGGWGLVSDWAKLRRDHGNPDPINIKYWEIGNEIYGGEYGLHEECQSFGWETVWTCDGREYVHGDGVHDGFLRYREEMKRIDPTILVGAVGVPFLNSPYSWENYTNWGNEVIEEAGNNMDFYIVHQYSYSSSQSSRAEALAHPQSVWPEIKSQIEDSFSRNGVNVPIAVTEYNMFAGEWADDGAWMTQGVNMLYMADTIGLLLENGFDMANQWDLANMAVDGTDYGMLNASDYSRYPQYYVFPLWAKFGTNMIPVAHSFNEATTLSVYAGKLDSQTISVMVINKTGNDIITNIEFVGAPSFMQSTRIDVARVNSLSSMTATYNGVSDPSSDLSNAPSKSIAFVANPLGYKFPRYSVTYLHVGLEAFNFNPTDWVYLPLVLN